MASNVPVVKQVALFSLIPQLIVLGLLIFAYDSLVFEDPFFYGLITYLILSFGLRNLVARSHRKGLRLVKQQQFTNAIPFFEYSVDFFTKNRWVDSYRFLTLLSSSRMTYKEMGLCNIAFCYSQIGEGQKASKYYEQVLKEFPENGLAIAGLKMISSLA
jgi:tetratricopeptide (TPR) repeat protein